MGGPGRRVYLTCYVAPFSLSLSHFTFSTIRQHTLLRYHSSPTYHHSHILHHLLILHHSPIPCHSTIFHNSPSLRNLLNSSQLTFTTLPFIISQPFLDFIQAFLNSTRTCHIPLSPLTYPPQFTFTTYFHNSPSSLTPTVHLPHLLPLLTFITHLHNYSLNHILTFQDFIPAFYTSTPTSHIYYITYLSLTTYFYNPPSQHTFTTFPLIISQLF